MTSKNRNIRKKRPQRGLLTLQSMTEWAWRRFGMFWGLESGETCLQRRGKNSTSHRWLWFRIAQTILKRVLTSKFIVHLILKHADLKSLHVKAMAHEFYCWTATQIPPKVTMTRPSIYRVLDELSSFDSFPHLLTKLFTSHIFAPDPRIWLSFLMVVD